MRTNPLLAALVILLAVFMARPAGAMAADLRCHNSVYRDAMTLSAVKEHVGAYLMAEVRARQVGSTA